MIHLNSILLLALLFLSCQSNTEKAATALPNDSAETELTCMQSVLKKDGKWGSARNHMCEKISLSETIQVYVDSLTQLNYSGCPEKFATAFRAHIKSWREMIPVTDAFPGLRGEMHDVFKEIENSDNASEFKNKLNRVWDTWYVVEALHKDAEMFAAIGGPDRWAKLKTLYIKAVHEEPRFDTSYISEIWRAVDHFKIRIEQQSKEFHNLGVFSEAGGWINYVHKDSARKLSSASLEGWKRDHSQNVYVVLNRLAKSENYEVGIDSLGRLEYRMEGEKICAFGLDSLYRPAEYFTPNPDGTENASDFKIWKNTNGFVHTAGGGPKDGSFSYETEIWAPSEKPFDELYTFPFNLDSLIK
ncbi:MAG: hypothetical protein AAFZ15_07555 [Bacteroidota bacterium]